MAGCRLGLAVRVLGEVTVRMIPEVWCLSQADGDEAGSGVAGNDARVMQPLPTPKASVWHGVHPPVQAVAISFVHVGCAYRSPIELEHEWPQVRRPHGLDPALAK